jgi:adrenodoxin-NADP+ reductase
LIYFLIYFIQTTDITDRAIEALSKSQVKRVLLIGRRGPLQAAFTIKELREMIKLDNCRTIFRKDDFKGVKEFLPSELFFIR